ncbi:DNA replication licensing factor MCM6-like [Rhododendron vialii]|uniref:DNA replication licensing factor MCM6-like n=1 Tax=Rhododendron vialii TaxID=182163 RepID=UPI00265E1673|nr:DNA replication licensing factor MCM6-like [Rhododendron vialii]XP_058223412.1 DNA replication licensing factor MCM6-like [Rhododendron vialii]XP_058223413.1 DNA replication licensing factor MCM6-like [Rhododendron vialii]XP_058223414.1 DNA replication licensing factor MCM6-like [Rhododendron vialii]XP_058223415.1 DNA replication licensing factor MCM6-like [Rhododendron vialii]XP_058223416.1 DNA replication licensing factor MCM6-like [Rhododendron vialii]XP_058223417.1 DNA replication lice
MRQKDLIEWYVSQLKEKNNNTSTDEAAAEVSKVQGVIECLVMEGHLIVVVDGMQAASEADGDINVRQSTLSRNDRILAVAPNKQGKTLVHKYPTSDHAESGAEPPSDNAECRAELANRQGKKLGISDEYLQRVTEALFMRLREGTGLAGMRERDLIEWYVIELNKKIENPSIVEASAEASTVISIIETLVRGGLLIVVDDGMQAATAKENGDNNTRQGRILALKPNLQGNPCVLSAEYFESIGAALVM